MSITGSRQLKRWLADKPRGWLAVIAVRAALRALPHIASTNRRHMLAVAPLVFRATARAYGATAYANWISDLRSSDYLRLAPASRLEGGPKKDLSAAASAACTAALAASHVVSFVDATEAARVAAAVDTAESHAAAAAYAHADVAAVWQAIQRDTERLTTGMEPSELVRRPLWEGAKNRWFDEQLDALRLTLNRLEDDWSIWFDWYSSLFEGQWSFGLQPHASSELDRRIAFADDGWWDRPPVEINLEVKRWVDDARKMDDPHPKEYPDARTVSGFVVSYLQRAGAPVTNKELFEAYRAAGGLAVAKTMRGELSRLAASGVINRLKLGLYQAAIPPNAFQIPPTQPATVRPVWKGAILTLPIAPMAADLDLDPVVKLFGAVRTELMSLARRADRSTNVDKRAVTMLRSIAALMPARGPTEAQLFRLARRELLLMDYAETVNAEWPAVLAADYRSVCLMLSKTLNQYPGKRLFDRNAVSSELEGAGIEAVREDIQRFADALGKEEFVDRSVPAAFHDLTNQDPQEEGPLQLPPSERTQMTVAHDQLESADNTFKEIAQKSVEAERQIGQGLGPLTPDLIAAGKQAYADEFQKNYVSASRKAGAEDAERAAMLANRSLHGHSALRDIAGQLIEKYPQRFGWLKNFVRERRR